MPKVRRKSKKQKHAQSGAVQSIAGGVLLLLNYGTSESIVFGRMTDFLPSRAAWKTGNTYSIPPGSELSSETKFSRCQLLPIDSALSLDARKRNEKMQREMPPVMAILICVSVMIKRRG